MTFMEFMPPTLAVIICMVTLSFARARARAENEIRVRQLEESADLLAIHAQTLDRFLKEKVVPDILKRVLINCSDAMSDHDAVLRIANWMSSRPMNSPKLDELPEEKEIMDQLSHLRVNYPHFADDFSRSVMTIAVGSILRWPESAALFEQIGTRMVASPKNGVGFAVTAASFRTEASFGLSKQSPVMA